MCWTASVAIDDSVAGPSAGRHEVATLVASHYNPADELSSDLSVIASELLTNSLQAGADHIRLDLHGHRHWVRVSVSDDGSGHPRLEHAPDDAVRGRGLAIVDALARQWGVEAASDGKSVWAVVDVDTTSTVDFDCENPSF